MFSYKCYAWIIAEANWTPFIWKNNGKSGSFYSPSWQFSISQRGPSLDCRGATLQSLHGLSETAYLLVCKRPSARGGGEAKKSATWSKSGKVAQLSWLEEALVAQSCLTLQPYGLGRQASLSMGFSRQEYWSGLPFPSPGDLPDPGIEPGSPAFQTDSWPSEVKKRKSGQHCPVRLG